MADNFKYVQGHDYDLSGSGIVANATSVTVQDFTTPDGTQLTMTDFGTIGYVVFEPGTIREENASFTGVTQNGDGTATLTGLTKGLGFVAPYTQVVALMRAHAGGTTMRVSNTAQFYNTFMNKDDDETITGKYTFPAGGNADAPVSGTVYSAPTDDLEYASKKYVDNVAIAGAPDATTGVKGIVEIATQAEVNSGATTGGTGASVVVRPAELAQSILTANFISGADAGGTDTYAITLPVSPGAYTVGQLFIFKANTANTGAASLNVNAIGALTIKKNHDQDLEDGDIEAGSWVTVVVENGTTCQLQTQQATMPSTAILTEMSNFFSTTDITGAEAETLSSGATSNADTLHTHFGLMGSSANGYYGYTLPFTEINSAGSEGGWTGNPANWLFGYATLSSAAASDTMGMDRLLGNINNYGFDDTTELRIVSPVAFVAATGGGATNIGFGIGQTGGGPSANDIDPTNNATNFIGVIVTPGGTPSLIFKTSNSAGGAPTTTTVTGVTFTDTTTYEIRRNTVASTVHLYVNGVLKATHVATLPTGAGDCSFGYRSDHTNGGTIYAGIPTLFLKVF